MNTRQSIETRYIGPTNHLGSRIIATTPSGHRLTHHWDYSLGIEANHYAAAKALKLALEAISAAPNYRVPGHTGGSYAIANLIEQALTKAKGQ